MSWYAKYAEAKRRIYGQASEGKEYNVYGVRWYPESEKAILILCNETKERVTLDNVFTLSILPYGGEEYTSEGVYDKFDVDFDIDISTNEPVIKISLVTPAGRLCFSAEYDSYYQELILSPHGAKKHSTSS